eukprot:8769110-Alexandrium_andersonii.AAC.1
MPERKGAIAARVTLTPASSSSRHKRASSAERGSNVDAKRARIAKLEDTSEPEAVAPKLEPPPEKPGATIERFRGIASGSSKLARR